MVVSYSSMQLYVVVYGCVLVALVVCSCVWLCPIVACSCVWLCLSSMQLCMVVS